MKNNIFKASKFLIPLAIAAGMISPPASAATYCEVMNTEYSNLQNVWAWSSIGTSYASGDVEGALIKTEEYQTSARRLTSLLGDKAGDASKSWLTYLEEVKSVIEKRYPVPKMATEVLALDSAYQEEINAVFWAAKMEISACDKAKKDEAIAEKANSARKITGPGDELLKLNETIGKALDENWNIPDNAPVGTSANVLIIIDRNGYIIKSEITKSSGNDEFDTSALSAFKAIYQIVPFESWFLDAFDDRAVDGLLVDEFGSLELVVFKDKK